MRILGLDITRVKQVQLSNIHEYKTMIEVMFESLNRIKFRLKEVYEYKNKLLYKRFYNEIELDFLKEDLGINSKTIENICMSIVDMYINLSAMIGIIEPLSCNECMKPSSFIATFNLLNESKRLIDNIMDILKDTSVTSAGLCSAIAVHSTSELDVQQDCFKAIVNGQKIVNEKLNNFNGQLEKLRISISMLNNQIIEDKMISEKPEHEILKVINKRNHKPLIKKKVCSFAIYRMPDKGLSEDEQNFLRVAQEEYKKKQKEGKKNVRV